MMIVATDPEKWKTIQLAMRGGWGTTARYVVIRSAPVGMVSAAGILAVTVRAMLGF
jgi:hypothetical protein